MKTSIVFIAIFAGAIATGLNVEWHSWIWGAAFGVSVAQLIPKRSKK